MGHNHWRGWSHTGFIGTFSGFLAVGLVHDIDQSRLVGRTAFVTAWAHLGTNLNVLVVDALQGRLPNNIILSRLDHVEPKTKRRAAPSSACQYYFMKKEGCPAINCH